MVTSGIERLRKSDMKVAIKLFQKGLSLEVPPGKIEASAIKKELESTICYVHKTGNELDGLVNFKLNNSQNIRLMFICTTKLRKGIGSKLVSKVVAFGVKNRARWIYSYVSLKDKRAVNFYHSLGFRINTKTGHFGSYIRLKVA